MRGVGLRPSNVAQACEAGDESRGVAQACEACDESRGVAQACEACDESRPVWAQACEACEACEACDESAVVVRLSVWRRMAPAAGLRFARREVGLRSNPDAAAATTSLLESHPYTRAAVMGYSNATDRTDLSRREHSLRPCRTAKVPRSRNPRRRPEA